jgi:hypothetical protein
MCQDPEVIAYNQKIVDIAKAIEYKTTLDVGTPICSEDYLKAKRYSKLLVYLAGSRCCPSSVKQKLIDQLGLNKKQ